MTKPTPIGPEEIAYSGKILEVVNQKMDVEGKEVIFERARRAPGVRLIISSKDHQSLLITKEHREEVGGVDYRLPGGKVFDTLAEYKAALAAGTDIKDVALTAAKRELQAETGLMSDSLMLLSISHAGATVEWDLYYFLVQEHNKIAGGQQLETGENIEIMWLANEQVLEHCRHGDVKEDRSVAALFKYLG